MKIFVSYSDKDRKKMNALEKAITESSLGLKAIIVAKDIKPGISLSDKVKDAINNCDILIPIITKSSITSQWVNQEIGFAIAKEKMIFPLVEKSLLKKLKGFIHNQLDIPFGFDGNLKSNHKESFRKSYLNLLNYLSTIDTKQIFTASITPIKIRMGDEYITKVRFKGNLKNGFFDNLVSRQDSKWITWNWDTETLPNPKSTAGGLLQGNVDYKTQYSHSTKGWSKGKYIIYVRVYDHPVVGEKGRHVVAEEIKEIEII